MADPLYLLDTGILLQLIRGNAVGAFIESTYRLTQQAYTPLVCIVTHGEIRSLAGRNNWGDAKRAALEAMLENLVTVDIHSDQVLDAYVEIDLVSLRSPTGSKTMGKNDLWIAAVARVTGATLLTTDTDFDHLHPNIVDRFYIDPKAPPPPITP